MFTHHFTADNESAPATSLVADITEVIAAPSSDAMTVLHDRLAGCRALDIADDMVRELRGRELPTGELRSLARALAECGTRRNAVAVGIIILGVAGDQRDRELLLTLGHLEDLTLYAAVALANTQPDRDSALHHLARNVDGWGRIHTVERLAGTQDPAIKAWLLREGFRNCIMNEYLAHLAATTGGLYHALLESDVDAELLDGAADIIDALVSWGGPAADIRHYPDALPVLGRFGELLDSAPPNLTRIGAAHGLKFLLRKELPPELDWPPAAVSRLRDHYSALLSRSDWSDHVRSVLATPDSEFELNRALQCSESVGIDAYPYALARLRTGVRSGYTWQWVAKRTPAEDLGDFARLAQEQLPLDEIASGPLPLGESRSLWLPDDHILEMVLARLDHASRAAGAPLLRAGIRGRTVRLRDVTINALERIYGPDLPADVREWVGAAAVIEPDDTVRDKLMKLLERALLDLDE
ncbi:hypothetical protein [Nocardia heshunensis]